MFIGLLVGLPSKDSLIDSIRKNGWEVYKEGIGYARVNLDNIGLNDDINFDTPIESWGNIVGVGLYETASSENLIGYAPIFPNGRGVLKGDGAPRILSEQKEMMLSKMKFMAGHIYA